MKLVIADDNGGFLKRLVLILSAIEGIEIVGEAQSVPDAIDVIRRARPDVVILDLNMPGGSGLDVLRTFRSRSSAPVVIVLTIGSRGEYQARCLSAGADYFFEKSSDLRNMILLLKDLVKTNAKGLPKRRAV